MRSFYWSTTPTYLGTSTQCHLSREGHHILLASDWGTFLYPCNTHYKNNIIRRESNLEAMINLIISTVLLMVSSPVVTTFAPLSRRSLPVVVSVKKIVPNIRHRYATSNSKLQVATAGAASSRDKTKYPTRPTDAVGKDNNVPPLSGLEKFNEGYQHLASNYYLAMAFIQAGVLASGADIATQSLEGADPINFGHVAAMATVASTMSGLMNAVWLRQLEREFPGTELKEVAAKTLIHAIIIASIINSAYLVGVPLFTRCIYGGAGTSAGLITDILQNPSIIFSGWKPDEFITLTKLEVLMFIPYNTLAFQFVPPEVRPLTHAAISATFNVAVSAVTLGYFDTWCQRATQHLGH